ncbi:MAG: 4-(cytidine 5'-diphospho)-2-C-methyl-D-erythritol kinase [Pyrinomonadaceae bacterium]
MFSNGFTLPSFAKINWTLRVLGQRADGYHDLRTTFQTITLHDTLSFAPAADNRIQLECNSPDVPLDEGNLVMRAARALQQKHHVEKGAIVSLHKRIPAMGGLGGGSSNAAVALLGFAQLWNLILSPDELMRIGARIGADVPFFFVGGTALGTGLGTKVAALQDVETHRLLIVKPRAGVSTAAAYKALDERSLTKGKSDIILFDSRENDTSTYSLPEVLYNDFEPVVFRLEPEIERARDLIIKAGARNALLSGSGACVFGVFEDESKRQQAASQLEGETGWQIFKCETLAREEYYAALGTCSAVLRS